MKLAISFIIGAIFASCAVKPDQEDKTNKMEYLSYSNEEDVDSIDIMVLKRGAFEKNIIANGKISSDQSADLVFRKSGIIETIFVSEGMFVKKGDVIAKLQDYEFFDERSRAELQLSTAKLEYEDYLLKTGYKLSDSMNISRDYKNIARIKSGLDLAILNLNALINKKEYNYLRAPFSGKVANIKAKPFNSTEKYDFICSVVDDKSFCVNFKLMEQELAFLKSSNLFNVQFPYPTNGVKIIAKLKSINPVVDKNGMVEVKLGLEGYGPEIAEGMNVNITISQLLKESLVVLKESVVERGGKKILFTYNRGRAKWNEVTIGAENENEYLISEGLEAGDTIICNGNFNLVHGKKLFVNKSTN